MHWQLSQTSSDIVVCASTVVTQHRRVSLKLPSHYGREQLLQTNILSMPCVIIRAKSFQLKRFLNIGHEDYHFWLSNVTDDIKISVLDEPLVTIFKSKNSVSSNLFRSAYWHWLILKEQKLSTPKRICYFLIYLLNALNKRWRFIGRIISL